MKSLRSKMIFSILILFVLITSTLSNSCQDKLYDSCRNTLNSTIYANQYQYQLNCLRIFFKSWCRNGKNILEANIDCNHNFSEECKYTSENHRQFLIRHHQDLAHQVNCNDISSLDNQFDHYIKYTYDKDILGYFFNICHNDSGYDPNCKPAKINCVAAAKAQCMELIDSDCSFRKGFLTLTTCNVEFGEFHPYNNIN